MNLRTWIAEEAGRGVALAEHLGVTKGAVWQGARYPSGLPDAWHQMVHEFTGAEVGFLDMLSDKRRAELVRRLPALQTEYRRITRAAGKA